MRWRAAAVASLLLVATSTWADAELSSKLQTLTPGVLRIGTYFANPPLEYVAGGKRVGFEVEIDRQPVFFDDLEHRRNCRRTFIVDRLAAECVAAVDLVHAEPRLQFSRVLEHRCRKDRDRKSVV